MSQTRAPLIEIVAEPEDREDLLTWAWNHWLICMDPHCLTCDRAGDVIEELS